MEILIKYKFTKISPTRTLNTDYYEVFSTRELNREQLESLIKPFSWGQTFDITKHDINKNNSLAYKFLYECEITTDSSD